MTKRKRYKRYSPEFKREALKRAAEEGVTDGELGQEYFLTLFLLPCFDVIGSQDNRCVDQLAQGHFPIVAVQSGSMRQC